MKQYALAFVKSIGFIAMYVGVNAVFLITYFIINPDVELEDIPANSMTLMLLGTQIIILIIVLLIYRQKFTSVVKLRKTTPKILLWSFLIGFAGINISVIIIELLTLVIPDQVASYIEAIEASIGGATFLLSFLVAGIMAPIVEEIAMRGMFFKWFEGTNIKPWLLIVLSGLLFGVFHLNLIQGTFATVIGIIYALGFYMTKSLWVPIIMHFANNAYAVIAGELPVAWFESTVYTVLSYAFILLIPIGFYFIKKELDAQPQLSDQA